MLKNAKLHRKTPLLLLILPILLSPGFGAMKPRRVALISSSGVNNDFRSWKEYDGQLQELGWQYDKFLNTELDKFFSRASDYDLVLTTSLWNYGDPEDMRTYIPQWEKYMRNGGVLVLTDMAYPPMCDWLSSLDPELYIHYGDASRDLGINSQLDLSSPSSFLRLPNAINAFPYWAHFPRWGKKYSVWAMTKGRTALGLFALVEGGILIVTTGFGFSSKMLENLYQNAVNLKSGLDIRWQKVPQNVKPSKFQGEILVKNLKGKMVSLEMNFQLKQGEKVLYQTDTQRIHISAQGQKAISVAIPCPNRGDFTVVVKYKTKEMEEPNELSYSFKIPPLVEVSLNRTLFAHSDEMKVEVRTTPREGESVNCRLSILDKSSRVLWVKSWIGKEEETIRVPISSLSPGEYLLSVNGEAKSESFSQGIHFKVSEEESPAVITKIGKNGELLINGKPFFPLGTYHIAEEDLSEVKKMGFNCVTSPIYGGDQSELKQGQLSWHNSAKEAGLWVITEFSEYIRSGRRNFEQAKELISQLRLHPSTIAHYAIDEPLGCGIGKDLVKQFCDLIKEVDPDHITFVNEVPGAVIEYAGIGDVTGTDPYPIGQDIPKSLAWVGEAVETTVKASGGKPVWAVIQAHRQPPANSRNRYPTPDEIRCMSYLALNHGAKGLLFYAWGDTYQTQNGIWESGFKFDSKLMEYFPTLLGELKEMGEWYLLGEVKRISSQSLEPSFIDVALIEYKGRRRLVAINPTNEVIDGRIKIGSEEVFHRFLPFEVFIRLLK